MIPIIPKLLGKFLYNNLNLTTFNETLYNKVRGNDIGMIFQDPLSRTESAHAN